MKNFSSVLLMSALLSFPVLAQTATPITSEDVVEDAQVESTSTDAEVLPQTDLPQIQTDLPQQTTEEQPNLGRRSTPLSSLVLTPPPLPKLEIELGQTQTAPKMDEPEMIPTSIAPSKPIDVDKNIKIIQPKPEPKKEVKEPVVPPKFETKPKLDELVAPVEMMDLFQETADVRKFNLSGFELGMTPDDVKDMAAETGWKIVLEKSAIPLFRESFYEQQCRSYGHHVVRAINNCIETTAKEDEVFFINEILLVRPKTRENISILFTSLATDNQAYKIYYKNAGDNSLGFTPKNMAAKIRRKEMFWNQMFEAYGYPDDADLILWGDYQKTYMQATMSGANYDAYISMEDKEIQDKDYFAAEDASKELRYPNQFTFSLDGEY